jgi:ABC-type phosphate/phosphonate transport system substrate-binding protein
VLGVASGDYDMAPVASDVYERMVARGAVKGDQFRVIWQSETFPTSSWSMPHDLKPELAKKISDCFMDYQVVGRAEEGICRRGSLPADDLQGDVAADPRGRGEIRHALQQGRL